MESDPYPLYYTAILLPALAFPAWILCIPTGLWYYSQQNVAAFSLVIWIILMNFCNSINPLIWPRDNIDEWFSGNVLCDIEVRIFVGMSVAIAACSAMVMRKLAMVMDTRNITFSTSHNKVVREKALELLWCWGYPILMMIIYYIVQPVRYFIYGISGCVVAYNLSWVSIVLGAMWAPITICVATYYAGLLSYRLYIYRREFHRLIAARNTTKSRFVRLFLLCLIIILILLPYSFWILWLFASTLNEDFSWSAVHGPDWNTVIKMPAYGEVRLDKWGQVACGYLAFVMFGTGSDANAMYKRMLCSMGLGKIFPSLYETSTSGTPTSSSTFSAARQWCSSHASKARSMFSKNQSVTESTQSTQMLASRNNSVTADTMMQMTPTSSSLQPTSTNDQMLPQNSTSPSNGDESFLGRLFTRGNRQTPVLPLFAKKNIDETSQTEKSPTDTGPPGVYAHAWASDSPTTALPRESSGDQGVHVIRELHQEDIHTDKENV